MAYKTPDNEVSRKAKQRLGELFEKIDDLEHGHLAELRVDGETITHKQFMKAPCPRPKGGYRVTAIVEGDLAEVQSELQTRVVSFCVRQHYCEGVGLKPTADGSGYLVGVDISTDDLF